MVQRLLNDVYVVDEARQLALRERGYGPPPVTSAAGGRSQRSAARQNRGDRERGRGGVRTAVPMGTALAFHLLNRSFSFLVLVLHPSERSVRVSRPIVHISAKNPLVSGPAE